MISSQKFVLAIACGVAVSAAHAAEESLTITRDMREVINRVDLGRQEVERSARALVEKGNSLLADSKYDEACNCYLQAKKILQKFNSPIFNSEMEYCDRQIARCYYDKAVDAMVKAESLAQQREFEEAIKLCREALKYCPEQAERLEERIVRYEKRRDQAVELAELESSRLMPKLGTQQYQEELLMEQGRQLVSKNDLAGAAKKFNEVLLINPFNAAAMQNLRAVNTRIGRIGTDRLPNTNRRLIAEMEWKYAIPYRATDAGADAEENLVGDAPRQKTEEAGNVLRARMQQLIVPELRFEEADLRTVIKYLADWSRRQDPQQRGVNFFLRRKPQIAPKGESGENPDGAAPGKGDTMPAGNPNADDNMGNGAGPGQGEENTESGAASDNPEDILVTLDIKNKSLLDVVEQICKSFKLHYVVEANAVVIAPEEVALDAMERKLFPVDIPSDMTMEDLNSYFEAAGVTFPSGSYLFYDTKISRLIAINTAANLDLIESVLSEIINRSPMIQIMVKFIEVSQNDIDELAFNWQLSVNANKDMYIDTNTLSSATIMQRNNQLMRYYIPETAQGDGGEHSPQTDATFTYMWGNSDGTSLMANVFALNWADSADVLYSPRITTLDKQTAHVEMITEQYFPESFNTIDIETTDSVIGWHMTGADPQPELENLQKLGLSFDITPEIRDREAGLIRVPVKFPIRTFNDWMEFDARTRDTEGNYDGEYYKMPIFNDRSLSCDVLVKDGETVLLAGVATDLTKSVDDKIPILGDLPLIGRFFQSKYSDSQKGNLLIFLTCRLVNPDGTAFNKAAVQRRGIPDFGSRQ